MSLIDELKRRNVFRVGTAYVVVGWLVLQVSDIVLDFVEAPAWVGKVIIALLAIGLVVAIVLSWLFDVTPEGIRRDDGSTGVDFVRAQRLNLITIIAAVCVALMFAWQLFRTPESGTVATSTTTIQSAPALNDASIAVLPFADLSPGGDQEYFSDGIAEEILNVLVKVEGLAVASRTSAFAFKGQDNLGIPAIGEALGVRHVLEGSVRSAGDTIRITAQLIDSSTDKHLWSQTYDRKLSAETIFAIQDEIASAIVAELSKSLNLSQLSVDKVAVHADTNNLDAYQLFLQGRQRFRVRSVDNIPGTIEIFKQAVALDPEFARAWAGLAAIAGVAPSWGYPGDDEDNHELAIRAAKTAIALDDSLSLPYAVLAYGGRHKIPTNYAYNFDMGAEALKRDPNDVDALLWRGIDFITVGQFNDAITDLSRCLELDPGYENCRVWLAEARLFAGDYDGAMQLFEQIAGSNSPSQGLQIALGLMPKTDRLTTLLTLAWFFEAFRNPLEPELVYRALTDADFDADRALKEYTVEYKALTGEPPDLSRPGTPLPIVFRRYEEMTPSPQNMFWWQTSLTDFMASPHRKRLIREMGIYDYWRERGFPPQCRAVGDDDFECDR